VEVEVVRIPPGIHRELVSLSAELDSELQDVMLFAIIRFIEVTTLITVDGKGADHDKGSRCTKKVLRIEGGRSVLREDRR
jgi:hypothetical protein